MRNPTLETPLRITTEIDINLAKAIERAQKEARLPHASSFPVIGFADRAVDAEKYERAHDNRGRASSSN
jgi:hypothetical protein